MRSTLSAGMFAAASCLVAQDLWAVVDREMRLAFVPGTFLVLRTDGGNLDWIRGTPLAAASAEDLACLEPTGEGAQAMDRLLSGRGWVLYGPEGQRLGQGEGCPSAPRILALMQGAGWRPMRDQARDHLLAHPEDGEALLALATSLAEETTRTYVNGPGGPQGAEASRRELAEVMGRLLAVTLRFPQRFQNPFERLLYPVDRDPLLTASWGRWREALLAQAARDPEDGRFLNAVPPGPEAMEAFWKQASNLPPVPGVPWPPVSFAPMVVAMYGRRPDLLASMTARYLAAAQPPAPGQDDPLATWAPLRAEALLVQGSFKEALVFLKEMRARSGGRWGSLAKVIAERCRADERSPEIEWIWRYHRTAQDRLAFRKLLEAPPLPDPPASRPQAAPGLEALDAFIRAHPERLDARRERLARIRPRLPDPDLEARFLEDALACQAPPGPLPFKPSGEAWTAAAERICAVLAEGLAHWPSSPSRWRAYVGWSGLAPRAPRPLQVLQDLRPWPFHDGCRSPGPLRAQVLLLLLQGLAEQGRHPEIDALMEVAWDQGLRAWLERWSQVPAAPSGLRAVPGRLPPGFQAEAVASCLALWGQALEASPDPRRLPEVRGRLEAIRAGWGDRLGRGKTR